MVEIVVGGEIPKQRLPVYKGIIPEKKIVGFLPLAIKERIVVVPLEAFDHVTRMASPLVDLSIRCHRID